MRVLVYSLLTMLIIALFKLRYKVVNVRGVGWELREDRAKQNRIYFDIKKGFLLECCDCGLSHKLKQQEGYLDCIPERPKGYAYRWRLGR